MNHIGLLLGCALRGCLDSAHDEPSAPDAGTEPTLIQVDVDGLTFDVRVAGPATGEPVMLLHGFPETSYEWRTQIRALAQAGYRVVAPDQRGYSSLARPLSTDRFP
ncbi:MAG TPA: alpha/beta fold hydrolase [Kofleriaceae bacterium]|nr:alpha/beta fold hydrolase [Kofleriaceae bacterium]